MERIKVTRIDKNALKHTTLITMLPVLGVLAQAGKSWTPQLPIYKRERVQCPQRVDLKRHKGVVLDASFVAF